MGKGLSPLRGWQIAVIRFRDSRAAPSATITVTSDLAMLTTIRKLPLLRLVLAAVIGWIAVARRGERPGPVPVEPLLWRRVPTLYFAPQPRGDAFYLVQTACGVPIDVDWKALAEVGIDRGTTIAVESRDRLDYTI